eukprot:694704-Rhodomonas_salina.4
MHLIKINVVEAKGLPKMDVGTTETDARVACFAPAGTVDAYLVCRCDRDGELFKTKVKRSSYTPVWDENFVFKGVRCNAALVQIALMSGSQT